ncbi:GntR family transcriptional regulator [Pseudomonas monteilii]|uniref:GntR family transcriptional regulator n=1 Tax=Pseudomonas monteilii TaxID=76759 RepID=UPI003D060053
MTNSEPLPASPNIDEVNLDKAPKRSGLTTQDVYAAVKELVISYQIRPEERVKEGKLAEKLGVSRTPLREALHRLVAENMLVMIPNRGFYGRKLQRQEVFDLYELRNALEMAAIGLAIDRASDDAIDALRASWEAVMAVAETRTALELAIEDENFHVALARLSGNDEMANSLESINARIRFFRWIDIEERRHAFYADHVAILDALSNRDLAMCQELVSEHISQRMEDIVAFIQAGVVKLYAAN